MNRQGKLLRVAAGIELATGVAFLIIPGVVIRLLFDQPLDAMGTALGRCFGIALLGLGIAAWPRRGVSTAGPGMLAYNALVALYLGYLGMTMAPRGPALWVVVFVHAVMTVALAATRERAQGPPTR